MLHLLIITVLICTSTADLLGSLLNIQDKIQDDKPEDAKLSFKGLVTKYGHDCEEYHVITKDGYDLGLFHIPGNKSQPVLLMHGILDSADTYLIRGNSSLLIALANEGYDVWAGNTRGNKYSRKHLKYNPDKDKEFWDFSFHESAVIDLPTIIDFVLNKTDQSSLTAIGHSQGTTIFFAAGAELPKYNEKIRLFIALAPEAFLNHLEPPTSTFPTIGPILNLALKAIDKEEVVSNHSTEGELLDLICDSVELPLYTLCTSGFIFLLTGADPKRLEPEFLPILSAHFPAGTSRRCLEHFVQIYYKKRFCKYDYGLTKNLELYGMKSPPDYNLDNISMKVALFVARNDGLSRVKDVKMLQERLSNVVEYYELPPDEWNHIDYVWGNEISTYVSPVVLEYIKKYSP